jgi:hypothetical protein
VHLELSQDEFELLIRLLRTELGEKRVEVRRTTFSHELHDQLEAEASLIRGMLGKLSLLAPSA